MKVCIFDLDGTLTDTLESLVYSVGKTLEEMGLNRITEEQTRRFVGNGARYLMEQSIRAAGDKKGSRIEEAMEVYGRIFDENCTYHVTPYDGIESLLRELKERDIRIAVLSNKPDRQTKKVVTEIFGADTFDYVSGQKAEIKRKPEPDGILHILDTFGVAREDCLYVGDSEVDVKTGCNAKVQTVAVTWGFRTKEELQTAGAKKLIHHPSELLRFL